MKSFTVFCVLAVVASVTCVPVSKKPEDDEVMIIPIPSAHPAVFDMDDGIVDTGYNGGYFSSYNPFAFSFTGLMQTMEGLMRQLREQATELQNLRPSVDWKDIGADGKGNTTSTVKVINGHKVTINETTYANQGENTGSVFKIRIVDVHPTDEEDTSLSTDNKSGEKPVGESKEVEETTPKNIKTDNESGSPELVEETANEIPHEKSEVELQA